MAFEFLQGVVREAWKRKTVCFLTGPVEAVVTTCNAMQAVNGANQRYKMHMCSRMVQGYILGG